MENIIVLHVLKKQIVLKCSSHILHGVVECSPYYADVLYSPLYKTHFTQTIVTINDSIQHNNFVWNKLPIHIGEDHIQSSVEIRFWHLSVLKHTSYYYSDLPMVM